MTPTFRVLIPLGLAFVGGWGGLVNTLVWWQILEAPNTRRRPEDCFQIGFHSWPGPGKRHPWFAWPLIREFRAQFPDSRLYFWYIVSIGWLFGFVLAAFISALLLSPLLGSR